MKIKQIRGWVGQWPDGSFSLSMYERSDVCAATFGRANIYRAKLFIKIPTRKKRRQ